MSDPFVQKASYSSASNVLNWALPGFTSANTAGNAIVVCVSFRGATSDAYVNTVTDTAGNTYTYFAFHNSADGLGDVEIWCATGIAAHAAGNVVTVGLSNAGNGQATAIEFSAVLNLGAGVLDQLATTYNVSVNNITLATQTGSTSGKTTAPGDLSIVAVQATSAGVITAPTGYTMIDTVAGASGFAYAVLPQSTGAPITAQWTFASTGSQVTAALTAFKTAASPASAPSIVQINSLGPITNSPSFFALANTQVTVGNSVLAIVHTQGYSVTGTTDNQGNTYSLVGAFGQSGGTNASSRVEMWLCPVAALSDPASLLTITSTLAGASTGTIVLVEIARPSGWNNLIADVVGGGHFDTAVSSWTTNNGLTNSSAYELVIAATTQAPAGSGVHGISSAPTTGYTSLYKWDSTSTGPYLDSGYKSLTAVEKSGAHWTATVAALASTLVVTFMPATTGAAPPSDDIASNTTERVTAAAHLTNWASVVLTAPLYTGVGSIVGPNANWSYGAPGVGTTVYYDPTYLTIESDGEVVGSAPSFRAVAQWKNGSTYSQLTIIFTSGLTSYATSKVLLTQPTWQARIGQKSKASSSLTTKIALSSHSHDVSTAFGVPTTLISMQARADGTFRVTANFSPSSTPLSAVNRSKVTATAALTTHVALGASVRSKATLTGVPTTSIPLEGHAVSRVAADGALSTRIAFTAPVKMRATATGGLSTSIALASATRSKVSARGVPTTRITLGGNARAKQSVRGVPTTRIALASNTSQVSIATSDFGIRINFNAAIGSRASVRGALTTAVPLASRVASKVSARGGLTTHIEFAADVTERQRVTASFSIGELFAAYINGKATATADLTTGLALEAAALSKVSSSLSLTIPARFGWANVVAVSQSGAQGQESVYPEDSACYIEAAYFDITGIPLTPNALAYRLDDLVSGMNIVDWTPLSPAPTSIVTITSTQNQMISLSRTSEQRQVLFRVTDGLGQVHYADVTYELISIEGVEGV